MVFKCHLRVQLTEVEEGVVNIFAYPHILCHTSISHIHLSEYSLSVHTIQNRCNILGQSHTPFSSSCFFVWWRRTSFFNTNTPSLCMINTESDPCWDWLGLVCKTIQHDDTTVCAQSWQLCSQCSSPDKFAWLVSHELHLWKHNHLSFIYIL